MVGRRARRRARRDRVRSRVRTDHRGPRPRVLDDPGRLRRRHRRELARPGRRPLRRRAPACGGRRARPSSPTGRSTRATSSRSTAGPRSGRSSSSCRRRTSRRPRSPTSWCWDDHDGDAGDQRDPPSWPAPGIVTYTDLPLPLPRELVPAMLSKCTSMLCERTASEEDTLRDWETIDFFTDESLVEDPYPYFDELRSAVPGAPAPPPRRRGGDRVTTKSTRCTTTPTRSRRATRWSARTRRSRCRSKATT